MRTPLGWPTVLVPTRRRVRWWRAGVVVAGLYVAGMGVLFVLDSADRPWWQWVVQFAGVPVCSAALATLWRLAARPRLLGTARGPWPGTTRESIKETRRALLRGDRVGAERLTEVAVVAAREATTPAQAAVFGAVAGNSAFIAAQSSVGTTHWTSLVALAVWTVGLPFLAVAVRQSVRIRRAAAALGVDPFVIAETRT